MFRLVNLKSVGNKITNWDSSLLCVSLVLVLNSFRDGLFYNSGFILLTPTMDLIIYTTGLSIVEVLFSFKFVSLVVVQKQYSRVGLSGFSLRYQEKKQLSFQISFG